ncbi:tRNA (adenosine(37)-N6)-threonylcarbamoyltransferase complex transferase subunit TsaD [Acidaminobacter sp. JC074]|uniref:tRNA (adenosine(37)-N6)-threonylcarbamoyltransferase complex transferase subunit TsaD n=1 Tax=Acidaminobacter sp. JC074 TaxID=2530199 RepID=UPI001F0CF7D8|nr:tRNA (adenosine(37)-N6)-threonylcarbamoyltransferase complex transferase subunit TsaD [Acidaminobacter sp. JC074]MCH4889248.1 tRNA (adenosine(37)-N6)-threonylcarbamoyltransferase complex transferase subunit TsaD [Acidaminobacter sp. JC074]
MDVTILSIETSCDETSAAIVKNGREVLSNMIYSQIDIHKKFGGVVPEVASRNHVEKISQVVDEAMEEAGVTFDDIDGIAVTYGPGLVGALLVGVSYAKGLSFSLNKPLVPVNHIEGHICANFIAHKDLEPPFISLVVSGGHTHIVHVKDYGEYEILGKTRDDAAGEAFDKVARSLGLGYPGGPLIDKLAKIGNEKAIDFPRVYLEKDSLDFSFSGIKSAVLNYLNQQKMRDLPIVNEDVAASFQKAVVEVITDKVIAAADKVGVTTIVLAGGVAANSGLRHEFESKLENRDIDFKYPPIVLCTDNAAMIGSAGYYEYINKRFADQTLNAISNLKLGEKYYVNQN